MDADKEQRELRRHILHHRVAFRNMEPPGPDESWVQIRSAGPQCTRTHADNWDDVDESSDESFPASDSSAKY